MTIQFNQVEFDGASQTVSLVTFDDGRELYCETLERTTPYAVQVTSGPNLGDDFVGLYDLDGEQIPLGNGGSWDLADDAPADVVEAVVTMYGGGASTASFERI